jgi:hypothetical protein
MGAVLHPEQAKLMVQADSGASWPQECPVRIGSNFERCMRLEGDEAYRFLENIKNSVRSRVSDDVRTVKEVTGVAW